MGVPKKRTSSQKRDQRRAANSKYTAVNVVKCPKCHEPIMSHTACANCGTYNIKKKPVSLTAPVAE